jgi:hypothetical protein
MRQPAEKTITSSLNPSLRTPEPAGSSSFSADALKILPLERLVDEFGPLDEAVEASKATAKKQEAYRKEIESRFAGAPADQSAIVAGKLYEVSVGPRVNERKIHDPLACYEVIRKLHGLDKIKEIFRPLLGDIDKLVPMALQVKFLRQARTGRRPVEAVRKVSLPAAKAA